MPSQRHARISCKYDPHADKHNRERNGALFFAAKGMQALLFATFAFFGLHTLAVAAAGAEGSGTRATEKPHACTDDGRPSVTGIDTPVKERYVLRFSRVDRTLHGFLMLSFLGLALTGHAGAVQRRAVGAAMARLFGGFSATHMAHRVFASIMIAGVPDARRRASSRAWR